ncbi:hypothetical protein EVAR_52742_1 [Eumeta japonica]|uniref:Uncharacterized protein n=1 Tax=Eumeta variegata TaxID=151549 RepID=A0A4C1Y2M1_EUMVA|nr:hypothetical protein EVAR_52742_1 [Eumeta japonica]
MFQLKMSAAEMKTSLFIRLNRSAVDLTSEHPREGFNEELSGIAFKMNRSVFGSRPLINRSGGPARMELLLKFPATPRPAETHLYDSAIYSFI